MSVTKLKRALEAIAHGEIIGYSQEERKEAFRVLNALERLEPDYKLSVIRDLHQELRAPEKLGEQITRARDFGTERERRQEQAQKQDRSRGRGR